MYFNKISCYFCEFCEICGLLEGLLCLSSKKLPPLAKKLVRSTCSKSIGAIKFLVTSAVFFLRIFGLIKVFFTFLLYKSELLPNLLFLLSSRYFLACFFRCNGNSCYFCGFCETEICGLLQGLLYLASLNRSMRYLIACLSCCNEKYCLLMQFLPNCRPNSCYDFTNFATVRNSC